MPQRVYVVYGTVAFSETGLLRRLEVIKPAFKTVRDDPGKQIINMGLLNIDKDYKK